MMTPAAPTLDQLLRVLLRDVVRDVVREVVREELAAAMPQGAAPAPTPIQPAYLTPRDVAKLLRVTEKSVRAWAANGTLKAVRLGTLIRIERGELDRFLAGGGNAGSPDVDATFNCLNLFWPVVIPASRYRMAPRWPRFIGSRNRTSFFRLRQFRVNS